MDNRSKILLKLFKEKNINYNANSISKAIGISSMGALKLLKELEKKEIVSSEKFGKALIYKINMNKEYNLDYLEFLLKSEAENSSSYVKRWINEIKKIKNADIVILFGSILRIDEQAKDIDVMFVVEKSRFRTLRSEIEKLNQINDKKIYPVYQSIDDFNDNILKKDKIILDSIKGIVIFGQNKFLNLMKSLK